MTEGGWDSHRWEINQAKCLLFCNHQWEVEAVNEEANTVSLYCLKVSFDAKVRWATA